MKFILIVFISFLMIPAWSANAEKKTATEVITKQELERRVKLRIYPGGVDEESLEVQKELPEPKKKIWLEGLQRRVYRDVFEPESSEE